MNVVWVRARDRKIVDAIPDGAWLGYFWVRPGRRRVRTIVTVYRDRQRPEGVWCRDQSAWASDLVMQGKGWWAGPLDEPDEPA